MPLTAHVSNSFDPDLFGNDAILGPRSLAADSLERNGESWSVVVECRRGVPSHGVFPNFRTSEIGCWRINWSIQVLELEIVKRCFRNNMKAHEL